MKTKNIILTVFLITHLISCDKEEITPNKVERLMLTQSNQLILSSTDTSALYLGYLIDFTIKDYKKISSVEFVVVAGCNQTAGQNFQLILYDMTNEVVIDNSAISFKQGECLINKFSGDIKDSFPDERINLGILVVGPDNGSFWGSYLYYLYLYRK